MIPTCRLIASLSGMDWNTYVSGSGGLYHKLTELKHWQSGDNQLQCM